MNNKNQQEKQSLAYQYSYAHIDSLLKFYKNRTWKHGRFNWKRHGQIDDLAEFIKHHLSEITKHKGKSESLKSLATLKKLKVNLGAQIKRATKKQEAAQIEERRKMKKKKKAIMPTRGFLPQPEG